MNPHLSQLQPYPFEKLRQLFSGVTPGPYAAINLGIGEPKHATPAFILQAMTDNLAGLASYPSTLGTSALRESIAQWIARRYAIPAPHPASQILPVNGSREALFAFAQTIVDTSAGQAPVVMCPNPFYQIYEGAALLAGATPYFVNADPARNFVPDYSGVPAALWQRVQLLFVCSPGNPTGAVMNLKDWEELFELSDRYGFVIASDECYSEIYFGDQAPLGALQAARLLGRDDYARLVCFSSLSKRSNVPGLRSGFVAGNAALLQQFLLYRTYHGCAMSPTVQAVSALAWQDEQHVIANRALYRAKFERLVPMLEPVLDVAWPDAGFYLWAGINKFGAISDIEFAKQLFAEYNVTVLPGSYLAREAHGSNPGQQRIRLALVAGIDECVAAAERLVAFTQGLS